LINKDVYIFSTNLFIFLLRFQVQPLSDSIIQTLHTGWSAHAAGASVTQHFHVILLCFNLRLNAYLRSELD